MSRKIMFTLFLTVIFSAMAWNARADESEKLDRVLSNQAQILSKLDEIKSELSVVKVRATER